MDGFTNRFNSEAKTFFLENVHTFDLFPMSERERCVLTEGVRDHLDSINNEKLTVLDSFYIRSYEFRDLGIFFSFIKKGQNFHFIHWPLFYKFASNDFFIFKDSIGEPVKSDYSISKINSHLVNGFFKDEVFTNVAPKEQYQLGIKLLLKVFPALSSFKPVGEFELWLDKQPQTHREAIKQIIDPIMNRKQSITGDKDYLISKIEYIGYVFYDFHMIDEATPDIELDVYFLPFTDSYGFQYQLDRRKFSKCFQSSE